MSKTKDVAVEAADPVAAPSKPAKEAKPEQPLLDAGCWISEAPGWWRNTAAFTYKNALGQWTAPSTSAMPLTDALEVESKRPK